MYVYERMYLGQKNVHRGGDVEMVATNNTVYTAATRATNNVITHIDTLTKLYSVQTHILTYIDCN